MHYTHLEDYIFKLYKSLSINKPEQLIKEDIAKKLKLEICYRSKGVLCDDSIILVKSTQRKEWMMFGHEMCHYLRHTGMQLIMHPLFRQLQEYQASYFTYHFCVPTFMLEDLKGVTAYDVMNLFNVDYDFAVRRWEMYQSKMFYRSDYFERTRS